MKTPWKPTLYLTALSILTLSLPPASQAEADFGDVAMRVAYMLRNRHYTRTNFDDAMSKRVFENYLEFLDYNRMYFTQEDIDEFTEKYETKLDESVFSESIEPAREMYERRLKWVEERVAKIERNSPRASSLSTRSGESFKVARRPIGQKTRRPPTSSGMIFWKPNCCRNS